MASQIEQIVDKICDTMIIVTILCCLTYFFTH